MKVISSKSHFLMAMKIDWLLHGNHITYISVLENKKELGMLQPGEKQNQNEGFQNEAYMPLKSDHLKRRLAKTKTKTNTRVELTTTTRRGTPTKQLQFMGGYFKLSFPCSIFFNSLQDVDLPRKPEAFFTWWSLLIE